MSINFCNKHFIVLHCIEIVFNHLTCWQYLTFFFFFEYVVYAYSTKYHDFSSGAVCMFVCVTWTAKSKSVNI